MLSSMEIRKSSRLKVQSLSKKRSEKWRLVCHLLTMPFVVYSGNSSNLRGIIIYLLDTPTISLLICCALTDPQNIGSALCLPNSSTCMLHIKKNGQLIFDFSWESVMCKLGLHSAIVFNSSESCRMQSHFMCWWRYICVCSIRWL